MYISPAWVRTPTIFILLALLIIGCSGGNPSGPGIPRNQENILLTVGQSSGEPVAGSEMIFPVLVSDAADLYAFSFRVEYDKNGLAPIGVDWGGFKGENDVVFNPLDKPGLLPLAYARLDGGGFTGDGTVCLLKFTVLDPSRVAIKIISDPEYLVAYDHTHVRLSLAAGGDA